MDVIIEGQIGKGDQDEKMSDLISTMVELKNCATPVLRINEQNSDLSGRILFSQGGFILGAKLGMTGESGYEAVRKLLAIEVGNYAILDPARKPTTELNQALWLSADRVQTALPNLPQSPDSLIDKPDSDGNRGAYPRSKTGQIDLAGQIAAMTSPKSDSEIEALMKGRSGPEQRQTTAANSASRRYNQSNWRLVKFVLQMGLGLGLCYLMMTNSSAMWDGTVKICKSFGFDVENNALFSGFQSSMENWGKQKAQELKQKKNARKNNK
ncbi:MAG: hypothetical protein K2Y32_10550 [Candidatus Obscuribacterales bacterium]|nr:hypothetical protein [Candidatus Obscuribacterales bacterium]